MSSYSARLIRPFASVIRTAGKFDLDWLDTLDAIEALDPDSRFPVEIAHQMLDVAVSLTGDADVGLKAARACPPFAAGAFNYVIHSAPTARRSIEAAARYMRLVNDVLDVSVELRGSRALVRLDHRLAMSRPARDFQLGTMYRAFSSIWDSDAGKEARVLLDYPAPDLLDELRATFDGRPLEFGAGLAGFELDAATLDAPLPTAEPRLHAMLLEHADLMLATPRVSESFRSRVERVIAAEFSGGDPGICQVATKLHMSPRTLERRLEREGTTFSALQDALRRDLALRWVENATLELTEVAFLLGFSQTTGFHRAFKRWTGRTPLDHRRATAGRASAVVGRRA